MARLILRLAADVIGAVGFAFVALICAMNAVGPLGEATVADRGIALFLAAMFLLATFALVLDLYRSLGRDASRSRRSPGLGVVPSRRVAYQPGVRRG